MNDKVEEYEDNNDVIAGGNLRDYTEEKTEDDSNTIKEIIINM
jgi:hypothetical protein